ncbi:hypothetical protein L3Q82_007714 [Scortum barcoo]|uniref:Uncharacterized protein n=1 Tax=Scortum barcoo TaxID=214431 RepID=A0ACB8WN92_9TELE|nr:hypothetical protein L3Q82_007714 [Scortum barcoo]
MVLDDRKRVVCPLRVGGEVLPQVEEFKYLGVLFTSEGKMEHEIDREAFQACPTVRRRPWGRPRTRWRDYVSQLAWERLGVPPGRAGGSVWDVLKVMKPTVDKVKAIVEFFHRSTTATEKLKSTQRRMGVPELKLKQECVTRWNSTFHMLKRILESKDGVISTLAVINAPVDPLSQEKWEVLQEACTVLEPFEQVTVEISTDRFKKLAFNDNRAVDEALQRVTAAAATSSQSALLPEGQEEQEEPQASAFWGFFEERVTGDTTRRNPSTDAILEVKSYLEEPLLQRNAEQLSWWETKVTGQTKSGSQAHHHEQKNIKDRYVALDWRYLGPHPEARPGVGARRRAPGGRVLLTGPGRAQP